MEGGVRGSSALFGAVREGSAELRCTDIAQRWRLARARCRNWTSRGEDSASNQWGAPATSEAGLACGGVLLAKEACSGRSEGERERKGAAVVEGRKGGEINPTGLKKYILN